MIRHRNAATAKDKKGSFPGIMRRQAHFAIVVFLGMQVLMPVGIAEAQSVTEASLLECVNEIRSSEGESPLAIDESLNAAAAMKLDDMKRYDYWSHANPVTGAMPWDFVEDEDYRYAQTGENLAVGYHESAEICAAWKNSPVHYANIVNSAFLDAGMAIEQVSQDKDKDDILVVMIFGGKGLPTPAEARNAAASEDDGLIAKSRNVIAFVIMFSYIATFLALLFNYIAKKKKGRVGREKPLLLLLAALSVIMTIIFFFLIT